MLARFRARATRGTGRCVLAHPAASSHSAGTVQGRTGVCEKAAGSGRPGSLPGVVTRLDEAAWRARAAAHRARVERWTGPHRERRRRREAHPVLDFLFTYYSHRPAQLEQWHPGPDVLLLGAAPRAAYRTVDGGVVLDLAEHPDRLRTAAFVRALLAATASRPPRLSCFGLHEWAMVYRTDAPRHRTVPLRLGAAGTDAVVESLPVHCTHHDAFRFFTAAAPSRSGTVRWRGASVR